jgi:hypothetical protein
MKLMQWSSSLVREFHDQNLFYIFLEIYINFYEYLKFNAIFGLI